MIKLINILKEIKSNISLEMIALYTKKSNSDELNRYMFDPKFETEGFISEYGKGANGKYRGKPVILCYSFGDNDDPFDLNFPPVFNHAVVFRKNIDEIYLDDEIFDYGDYPSKELEKKAIDFIYDQIDNGKIDISLGDLHNLFKAKISQDSFPNGNYVLNIKPNEIVRIVKNQ